jgi:hypothetical protein
VAIPLEPFPLYDVYNVTLLTGHIFCGIFTSQGAVFDVCGCLLASARTALPDEPCQAQFILSKGSNNSVILKTLELPRQALYKNVRWQPVATRLSPTDP